MKSRKPSRITFLILYGVGPRQQHERYVRLKQLDPLTLSAEMRRVAEGSNKSDLELRIQLQFALRT